MAKRGNDAIPTWSGFNYQGKIMLLRVIELINKNFTDDLKKYSVELERQEDFAILENGKTISLYQVKAYLSTKSWVTYAGAMDKLINHRNAVTSSVPLCYLVASRTISNWADPANTYSSDIKLYLYNNRHVDVTEVKQCLQNEISVFLTNKGVGTDKLEAVYSSICIYLDDEIAKMHKQGKSRIYTLTFADIIQIMENALTAQCIREEYNLKESVFEFTVKQIRDACNKNCLATCGKDLDACLDECAARNAYEYLLSLKDPTDYCRIIVPNETDGWNNPLSIISYFNKDILSKNIFHVFEQTKTPQCVEKNENCICFRSKYCNAKNKRIIPTILDLSFDFLNENSNSLQTTFQDIKDNRTILDALEGNAITAICDKFVGPMYKSMISSAWVGKTDGILMNDYYRGIEIISKEELLDILEKNGGNDIE